MVILLQVFSSTGQRNTCVTENEIPRKDQEVVADTETAGDTFVCYNSGRLFTTHNKTHSSESGQFEALHVKEENMHDNFSQECTMLIDSETSVLNKRSSRARESVSSKDHQCTKCNYKTTKTEYLKRHLVTDSDNRIISRCIYCNKTFVCKRSLDDHIVRIHPDFMASVSRKVHECTKCTFKTVFTRDLKRHMIIHSDIADNNRIDSRCIYCDTTFAHKRSLDDHIVRRHPDFIASVSRKIYECAQCIYKSTIAKHLREHSIAKHPETTGNRTIKQSCVETS
ncbi:unnamed protein product [Callosobruchus maculatus]|uniref:C2H2-type domain-containing protein n=1 Tax=Callosobruchus maculatus TaxID=64391 RepID=A0A653CMV2_CALMS|nr:unnamed protein product [Callosobruchus maculatus]